MAAETSLYASRGVSSKKEDVHAAIAKTNKGLFPKAFCKIVPDYLGNDKRYCIAMHADGAGTKSSLAYAYWKETGDVSVWKGIAQDALVMNIDDLLCAGATGPFLVSSTIGRNKNLIPAEVITAIINGTQKLADEFKKYGIEIIVTGGETADVGDLVRTVIVDSTVAVRMKRKEVINNSRIVAGDVIVGLASDGKAKYEKEYNSGIGSNGLTSARHDFFSKKVGEKYPETFDPMLHPEVVYCGKFSLTDEIKLHIENTVGSGKSLPAGQAGKTDFLIKAGKLILSPTRTYSPVIKKIFKTHRKNIHGMIHCTGGGQTKALHFTDKLHIIKDNLFTPPHVFRLIQESSQTSLPERQASWKEMYQVFNMGHRMEIYLKEKHAEKIIEISKGFGVDAKIVGRVEKSSSKKLTIRSEFGTFEY